MTDKVMLEDLSRSSHEILLAAVRDTPAERASQRVSKEEKVRLLADVLHALAGLTLPQQRQVLRFAIFTLELASRRFWRDK